MRLATGIFMSLEIDYIVHMTPSDYFRHEVFVEDRPDSSFGAFIRLEGEWVEISLPDKYREIVAEALASQSVVDSTSLSLLVKELGTPF